MNCPLCKASVSQAKPVPMKKPEDEEFKQYGWVQCLSCHLLYRDPMPTEEFLKEYYETSYRQPEYPTLHDRVVQLGRAERIIKYMKDRVGIQRVQNMLDFGCANGTLLDECRLEWGCEVFGVEMNPKDRQIAKDRGIETSSTLDDGGYTYDLVVLAHVLEHLIDPVGFLDELKKRVLPGGYVVFEMPHPDSAGAWMEAHMTAWIPDVFKSVLTYSGWEHVDTLDGIWMGVFHAAGRRP